MNISVTRSKVTIEKESLNKGEYNVRDCVFTFSEEYEGLILKALFTIEDTKLTYEQSIVNNICTIPYEATVSKSKVTLGVIGYSVEDEELVKRYSPAPDEFFVYEGSYIEDIENQSTPTPSQLDQIDQRVSDLEVDNVTNKQDIADIKAEQITQNTAIETNTDNISSLTNRVGDLETDNATNKQDISNIKQEQIVQNTAISNKVDKVEGKGLSTEDYTTADKNKLAGIETGAEVNVIEDVKVNNTSLPVENKTVNITMPTKVSDLDNDSGFIDKNVDDLTNYTDTTGMTSAINTAIGNETTARQGADVNLQNQIDAITSASDVVDVVGTYTELENYDTTSLTADDVIKVLQDSTHNNALSYYRWKVVNNVGSWQYVGSEGPFYTKGESDVLLNGKQDKIDSTHKLASDLVDDTNQTNKFTTTEEKTTWNGKYNKPSGGIPKTDLDSSVQASLDKADTALQQHQDISGKEDKSNKVTSISSSSTDTEYPSAKCVYDIEKTQDDLFAELQEQYNAMLRSRKYTTGSGENVTLNNTAEGVIFRKFGIGGNSKQQTYTGKNLLEPMFTTPKTSNGVTVTLTNKGWKIDGTSTSTYSYFEICKKEFQAGTYVINGISGSGTTKYLLEVAINGTSQYYVMTSKQIITLTETSTISFRLYCYPGYGTFNGLILPYQLEIGTVPTDTYEPYVRTESQPLVQCMNVLSKVAVIEK